MDETKSSIEAGACLARMGLRRKGGFGIDSEGCAKRSTMFVGGLGLAALADSLVKGSGDSLFSRLLLRRIWSSYAMSLYSV